MADLHALPLIGRDLPYASKPKASEKVKVFKANGRWYWSHECGQSSASSWNWDFWSAAYCGALNHARRCC